MAKKSRVWDGTAWQELASAQTDLTAYSTTAQMNTAISAGVGLVPILTQTIGTAVSSVVVNNVFSADYDAYKIVISGGVASTATFIDTTLTGSTASYAWTFVNNAWGSGNLTANQSTSYSSWLYSAVGTTDTLYMNAEIVNPFLAKYTIMNSSTASNTNGGRFTGIHQLATSYTGFTVTPWTGTLTGGTIKVYGYK